MLDFLRFYLNSLHMTSQADFLEQYTHWYTTTQGSLVLASTLHLTKEMISPWPRRGHNVLAMGFGHWKSLEMLWESGFDVSAIAASQEHMEMAKQYLHQKVDLYINAFDHLPFDDKTFDYVILRPPPRKGSYPSLQAMFNEASRLATKGILLQFWNNASLLGLMAKRQSLPYFLEHSLWSSWQTARKMMRKAAPQGTISTGSTLLGLPKSWNENSWFHKLNSTVIPLPIGALVHLRLDLIPKTPLTSIPLRLDPVGVKSVRPLVAMERHKF